jgi:tyrosine-protein kinase Etk/Wzc
MTSQQDMSKSVLRLLAYHRGRVWWIISRLFIATVILTILGLAFNPKYVARTKLTLLPTRSEIGYAQARPEVMGLSPANALSQTHVEALLSRTLAEDVARDLKGRNGVLREKTGPLSKIRGYAIIPTVRAVNHVVTLANTGRWKRQDPVAVLAGRIRSHTKVQNVPGSFVFEIAVTWDEPSIAALIANLLTDRYMDITLDASREEMRRAREFIEARIGETEKTVAGVQKKITEYRASENVFSTSSDTDLGMEELSSYLRDLNATRVSWQQLDARMTAIKPYQTPAAVASIDAERTGLKSRQQALEKVIEEQINRLDKMPAKEAGLLDLYRERMIAERSLTGLQDRLLDTKVAEAAQLSTARVIDRAVPPDYPEAPLLLRNAAVSIVVGLLLSVGFVLVSEARRPGLRSPGDMGGESGALLGLVPCVSGREGFAGASWRMETNGLLKSSAARQNQAARRHVEHLVLRLAGDSSRQVCLFMALKGEESKSQLIARLADVAAEAGQKVLLIDASFNDPVLTRILGAKPAEGLAELLSGEHVQAPVMSVRDGVDLMGPGLRKLSVPAKWALGTAKQTIAALSGSYDLVFIDSAPLLADTSAVRLLPLADRVICAINADSAGRSDLQDLRNRLADHGGRIDFVLLNVRFAGDHMFTTANKNGNGSSAAKPMGRTARSV